MKLWIWRAQKCSPLVGAETPLTCAGWQTTPSHWGPYRTENGKLHKLEFTYHHGTVFPPKKYLYPKEATDMEQKCIPLVDGETQLTCADRQTTPSHRGRYRAENKNLHKLWWTYRHGTVFAPRQYLYLKEATGMELESPKMYFTCRCRNPTYMCEPINYPDPRGAI